MVRQAAPYLRDDIEYDPDAVAKLWKDSDSTVRLLTATRDRLASASDWSSAGLESATFCVVDLETTGGSPGFSKVTEIGAVRMRGGAVERL